MKIKDNATPVQITIGGNVISADMAISVQFNSSSGAIPGFITLTLASQGTSTAIPIEFDVAISIAQYINNQSN